MDATTLANKPSKRKPMYNNEWKIGEINLVPTTNAIYGVKTEHSRHKHIETSDLSCRTDLLCAGNLIADKEDTDGGNVQTGLAHWNGYACHMADSLYFLYLMLLSISKIPAPFLHTLWSSLWTCWTNFNFSI
jgi:hypothetical protein